jgi:hypothetical protein
LTDTINNPVAIPASRKQPISVAQFDLSLCNLIVIEFIDDYFPNS